MYENQAYPNSQLLTMAWICRINLHQISVPPPTTTYYTTYYITKHWSNNTVYPSTRNSGCLVVSPPHFFNLSMYRVYSLSSTLLNHFTPLVSYPLSELYTPTVLSYKLPYRHTRETLHHLSSTNIYIFTPSVHVHTVRYHTRQSYQEHTLLHRLSTTRS